MPSHDYLFWETSRLRGAKAPNGDGYTLWIQPAGVHRPWPNAWDGLGWAFTSLRRLASRRREWEVLVRRGGPDCTTCQEKPFMREMHTDRKAARNRLSDLVTDIRSGLITPAAPGE